MYEKQQHQTTNDIEFHCNLEFNEDPPKDIEDLIKVILSFLKTKADVTVFVLLTENKIGRAYMVKKNFEPEQFKTIAIPSEKNSQLYNILSQNNGKTNSIKAELMLDLFSESGHYPVVLLHMLLAVEHIAAVALAGHKASLVWNFTDQSILDMLGKNFELSKTQKEKRLLSHALESLSDVNKIILENGSFESALASVFNGVNNILGAEGAGFLFYDEETKSLTLQKPAFGSYDDQLINLYKVTIEDGGNAVKVFQSQEPYLSNNVPEDPRIIQSLARLFNVRNIVSTPVKVSNKCIGVFHVINKPGGFSSGDLGIIKMFVSQLAIALENAYLYDREKKMAKRLQRFIELNERLLRLVLKSAGIQAITNTIALYLTAGVIFCDNRLVKRAWSPQDTNELKDFDPSQLLDMKGRTFKPGSGGWVPFKLRYKEDLSREVVAASIDVDGNLLGYLFVIMEPAKYNEDYLSVIQRTIPVYALELLKEQVAREVMQNIEGDFVSALLDGKYVEEQIFRQASGLGYDISIPRVVVVAELDSNVCQGQNILVSFWRPSLYEINLYLKHHYPQSFAVALKEQLIILLSYSPSQKSREQNSLLNTAQIIWKELERITGRKVYIGIGRVAQGIKDLEGSYKDALFSIKYIRQTKQKNQVVAFRDLGLYQALVDENAAGHLYNLMQELLGPLLESDKNKGTTYLKTLDEYFTAGCCIKTAAEILFCHVNTVRYRLGRAKKLSRMNVDDIERRFDMQMSLQIAKFYYPNLFEHSSRNE